MTGSALSAVDRARIAEAIAQAEAGTSGEIVVLVAARAGLYRSVGLSLALIVGLALPWPLIALTSLSAASIAVIQAAGILATLLVMMKERHRLAVVPLTMRRRRAHEAALREFLTRGLTRTRARTGVLIYVALSERYAEIVADKGVRARIPDEAWCATVSKLLATAGRGDLAGGLTDAVEAVGGVLAAGLPGDEGGDQLPNRVIVLD